MTRVATKNVELSNGTIIPKGARLVSPNLHMWSEDYYKEPYKFDAKRFLKLREHQETRTNTNLLHQP